MGKIPREDQGRKPQATTPTVLNLNDKVSLRDIHTKLRERLGTRKPFTDWVKQKLEGYVEGTDFTKAEQKSSTLGGTQTTNEYYTTVQVAMEIVASGHGGEGLKMRRFMSSCVRKVVENQIELPYDPKDPMSMLKYSVAKYQEERTL